MTGADDRGLMYALLDVAERIGLAGGPAEALSFIRAADEKPALAERGCIKYTFNKAQFEKEFFDKDYWSAYLDALAANRFNTFYLIFGYENGGYLAPPYPYFFDLPEFPEVKAIGIDASMQQRYNEALHRVIAMAHERGISFTLGIWDHIAPGLKQPTPGMSWGVTPKNLIPYTLAALGRFIDAFPEIDNYQFRMHGESGLTNEEMDPFWVAVYRMWLKHAPGKQFEARAKGVPEALVLKGLDLGVKMRLDTKIWCEQAGLPFSPTHINRQNQFDRRHSYADMLYYPKRYDLHWTQWDGGTNRVLLWGDPAYARRLAQSIVAIGGASFAITEPLATKMHAAPLYMPVFDLLGKPYQYTDYEFQRYWHMLQVYGRFAYNPNTPDDQWDREFQVRFGAAGSAVEQGLHFSSWILPLLNASQLIGFPTTAAWPEKQCGFGLAKYAMLEPSDIQQFASVDEEARMLLANEETAKTRPEQSARWLGQMAEATLGCVAQAEQLVGDARGKEFNSTMIDLKMLAALGQFHARRLPAAVSYRLFKYTGDIHCLDDAIGQETSAIKTWEQLVADAGDVYAPNMKFGRMGGHWREELKILTDDLQVLEKERQSFKPKLPPGGVLIAHLPIDKSPPGKEVEIRATIDGQAPVSATLFYAKPGEPWQSLTLKQARPLHYQAVISTGALEGDIVYCIEAADGAGHQIAWPEGGKTHPHRVRVTSDNTPPELTHTPITRAPAGQPLKITVQASDPSGVKWVHLRYRSVCQFFDYKTLALSPTGKAGEYQTVVPGREHSIPSMISNISLR